MTDSSTHEHAIFYSWQSDAPNGTNRGFIQEALKRAVRDVAGELAVEEPERPEEVVTLQHDTSGVAGSPDIAHTIFDRIESATAFVADISIIGKMGAKDRPSPNPNVLVELGYALHALGNERVILVVNTALGQVEDLPFDLRGRRMISYALPNGTSDKADVRKALVKDLVGALKAVIAKAPRAPQVTALDTAIEAVEREAKNRSSACRDAIEALVDELDQINVHEATRINDPSVVESMRASMEHAERLSRLARTIAEHGDAVALGGAIKGFEVLVDRQWVPSGRSGPVPSGQLQLFEFTTILWILVFAVEFRRADELGLLQELIGAKVHVTNKMCGMPSTDRLLAYTSPPGALCPPCASFPNKRSPTGELLHEYLRRFDDRCVRDAVDADILLVLGAPHDWTPTVLWASKRLPAPRVVQELKDLGDRADAIAACIGCDTSFDALDRLCKVSRALGGAGRLLLSDWGLENFSGR